MSARKRTPRYVPTGERHRDWARGIWRWFHHPLELDDSFDAWYEYVSRIKVKLHPGGRATMRVQTPGIPDSALTVELRWTKEDFVTSVNIEAEPGSKLPMVDLPISACYAALGLALEKQGVPRQPAERPAAGKPISRGFYERIKAEYDDLVQERHPSPVKELAARYKAKPATVKGWVWRAQTKYAKGAGDERRHRTTRER